MSEQTKLKLQSKELLEKLAELEHEQWGIWMTFLRSISISTGSVVAQRKERWSQWKRQANTPYHQLSEREKESDREFARKVIELILREVGV